MTRQESETELAGKVAASLTPRIQHQPLQQRGEQNSGLFDIGAMYAASSEQVMRRAQQARQPTMGLAQVLASQGARNVRIVHEEPHYAEAPLDVYEEVDLAAEYIVIPGLGPAGPIGWFAIAVAWLATATLAAGIATLVPAHGLKGELAPVAAKVVQPVVTPVAAVIAAAPAPATGATTATVAATATTTAPAPATITATAMVTPAALATPPAVVKARPAPPRPHVVHAAAMDAPASSPSPVLKAAAVSDATPAPKAVAPKAAPVAAAAAPAPAGGGSLEDLIRQAVAAESKKH